MLTQAHVSAVASAFHNPSDGQARKSQELILLLLECSPEPFSRSQFTPGHITCTGFVLAPDRERVLVVHHRRLNRWLLPGGHIEPTDDWVWDSARREVTEETSVDLEPEPVPLLASMDVHGIPSNGREPYHLHHDLLFAFRAVSDRIICSPESREVAWCSPAEFDRYDLPQNIQRAYHRIPR
jgi:8-oxo-dGTP pyrophosphatase MutT (NUDIX family)